MTYPEEDILVADILNRTADSQGCWNSSACTRTGVSVWALGNLSIQLCQILLIKCVQQSIRVSEASQCGLAQVHTCACIYNICVFIGASHLSLFYMHCREIYISERGSSRSTAKV